MNQETERKLKEAARLLSEAIIELGVKVPTAKAQPVRKAQPAAVASLPERIIALRDSLDFFRTSKTSEEVLAEFQDSSKPTYYPCEPDRVGMALVRLIKRGELRKISKEIEGKKKIAYVW